MILHPKTINHVNKWDQNWRKLSRSEVFSTHSVFKRDKMFCTEPDWLLKTLETTFLKRIAELYYYYFFQHYMVRTPTSPEILLILKDEKKKNWKTIWAFWFKGSSAKPPVQFKGSLFSKIFNTQNIIKIILVFLLHACNIIQTLTCNQNWEFNFSLTYFLTNQTEG